MIAYIMISLSKILLCLSTSTWKPASTLLLIRFVDTNARHEAFESMIAMRMTAGALVVAFLGLDLFGQLLMTQ